jgi:phenylalanyl-tRNA synthetase beta chain
MEVKQAVFYAEIAWDNLLKMAAKAKVNFEELAKFPSVRRDLALVLDKQTNYQQIEQLANKELKAKLKEVNLFDVYENTENLGENKKSYSISFILQDTTKTLTDSEIDTAMQRLVAIFEKELGAIIRK